MKNDQDMDDPVNMSSTSTQTNAGSKETMEGGRTLCVDTSVTPPVQSVAPDIKDTLDVPDTSDSDDADSAVCSEESMPRDIDFSGTQPHNSDRGDADSAVCSEASMPRYIDFSITQPHKRKETMDGGEALCEDTSVTHPVQSDDPDVKDTLDDPHTRRKETMDGGEALCVDTSVTHPVQSDDPDVKDTLDDPHTSDSDDADSAVCSEESMPRDIDFSGTQPHNFRKHMEGTATNSHEEPDRMSLCSEQSKSTGPSFSEDNNDESLIHQVCKHCEGSCGVCLGNVHHAVKHCETCNVSYCETHVADHYTSRAFSSHQLAEYKKTSRVSPATEHSLQRSSSGISWMLLIILNVLTTSVIFHHFYKDPVELPKQRVMMLGKTGTGKSASGNTILGREAFKSEASALPVTKSCDSQSGVVEGRNITVTDTPPITTGKAAWLLEQVDPGSHVFLLVIRLGRFTEEDGEEVKWIQRNFGEEALKFTIVLFTGRDQINAEEFLNESSGLQTLVSSTGGGYHIFDNKTPREHGQVMGLLEKIELLLRKNKGYSYSYGLHEQVKTAVREEEEMKRSEEERERREKEQERREEERKIRENKQERREEERKRREKKQERREEERKRREKKQERREEERKRREKKQERREEERKRREKKQERREEERKRREEERERRKEKRREERTTEQSWNLGNILNGFIGFVLRVIMKKIWYL